MSDRSHIAIYLPSLRGGGAERVMVTLANRLSERGHRVDLVLVTAEGPYLPEVSDRVNIIDLGRRRVLASVWALARYLRRERPDAMLSAMVHANIGAILAHMLAQTRTRLVVSERNSLAGLRGSRGAAFLLYLMRYLYPRTDSVVTVSQGIARELISELKLSPAQVTAIPNPVDIDHIAALAAERPQHPWLAPGAPAVILAVGRLEAQKDYTTLLAAFARVRAHADVRLIILGEGRLRSELERCIADAGLSGSVLLAGFHANPFGWMAAAKVYVLSSRYEGFPNSLIQAMACDVQVVSTNCPTGPDEILESGKWGRLVPIGNVEALAEAMIEALDDPSRPKGHVRLQDFHPDTIVADYERILI